jgi:hypothetical protein
MSLTSFLTSLGFTVGKNEVAKSCDDLLDQIKGPVGKSVSSACEAFGNFNVSSKYAVEFEKELNYRANIRKQSVFVTYKMLIDHITEITDLINKKASTLFSSKEATAALSFQKANYLRMIASLTFAVEYISRSTSFLVANELEKPASGIPSGFVKADSIYLDNYRNSFFVVAAAVSQKPTEIIKAFDDLPDAIVSELTEATLPVTMGVKAVDPMMLANGFLNIEMTARSNPFFLLGTVEANWQAKNMQALKDEMELVSLRLLMLEKKRTNQNDPALERQIESVSKRLGDLRHEREQLERKYGLDR